MGRWKFVRNSSLVLLCGVHCHPNSIHRKPTVCFFLKLGNLVLKQGISPSETFFMQLDQSEPKHDSQFGNFQLSVIMVIFDELKVGPPVAFFHVLEVMKL
jgi:hypothetical protein